MNAEDVIGLVIICVCALFIIGIGIYQLKSKTPVGFWSLLKPPKEEDIRDIPSYNKKHGMMWILYGIGMIIAYLLGIKVNQMYLAVSIFCIEIFGGYLLMVLYHKKLDRIYYIKHDN